MGVEEKLIDQQLALIPKTYEMVMDLNGKVDQALEAMKTIPGLQRTQDSHEGRIKALESAKANHEARLQKIEHKGYKALKWAGAIVGAATLSGIFGKLIEIVFRALHLIK